MSRAPRSREHRPPDPDDAREVALAILCAADSSPAAAERERSRAFARAGLDSRSRRFVTTLVQTTHRWRGRADRVLDTRLERGLSSLDPCTRNILRLAYVQLFHLDAIPAYAVVDTAVELTRRHEGSGKARLVNGILRGLSKRPPSPREWGEGPGARALEGELSHPAWLLERWIARWGMEETRRICAWNNEPARIHLRVSGGAQAAEEIARALQGPEREIQPGAILEEALRVQGAFDPVHEPAVHAGQVTVQDESQMLVGRLWPDARARAFDLCASPGTKASHLAEQSGGAPVFASDVRLSRARLVASTSRRMRQPHLHALVADGRRPPYRNASAERVLLDAPCTSLGVLQRRPDARWLRGPEAIAGAARLQAQLLDAAAVLVAPGKWLLYSVCTLEPEETDAMMERFRARHPEFSPHELPGWVPEKIRAGAGIMRILPGVLGMEGVYAALMRNEAAA